MTLISFGGPAAYVFAILHGAGNGILTIAKGTLPLALFGPAGHGQRICWLNAPARILQADERHLARLIGFQSQAPSASEPPKARSISSRRCSASIW